MQTINRKNFKRVPASGWLLAAVAACSFAMPVLVSAQTAPMPPSHGDMSKSHSGMDQKGGMDAHKSMGKMQEKMAAMPKTGNPDVDFAMMMREHHQGAIDMAQAELANGKDPTMRSAAKKIIAAQKKEIAEFDRWLAKHNHKH